MCTSCCSSAGLGRTGTFIALDALHRHGQETGVINVERFVRLMRRDRMNMVQNLVSFNQECCKRILHLAMYSF